MAEYFPLLDRAVSGLTEPTAEARRSIYERARTALIGQLRGMEPAVPEEDITRESTALDEAIARVEARFTTDAPSAPVAVPPALPVPPRAGPPPASPSVAAPARVPPPLPIGAPPVVPPPSRERPTVRTRVAPSIDRPTAPVTAPVAPRLPPRSTADAPAPRGTRPVMALRPVPGAPAADAPGLPVAGRLATETPAAEAASLEKIEDEAKTIDVRRPGADFAEALDAAGRADLAEVRLRDAGLRPAAPRPRQARRLGWPAAVASLVALVVVIGIGIAAYRIRDRPEQVVAGHAQAVPADAASPGKVAERAKPTAADADAAAEPAPSGVAVPAPVVQGSDAGPTAPSIAVAQRAALLIEAPEEPQRVKTYLGTVVWHLDSVSPGQGQPLASAVKADIDIPEAKLKATMLMQKNPEPQLPASHTMEFHFLPQPGNVLGNVKQINVPEMRKDDDAPTGEPLAGVPVAITENYFLVGLSRGGAEGQNTRLIADRNWFDMGLLFASGKLGKLTFEKGAAGQRTFEEALKAWK